MKITNDMTDGAALAELGRRLARIRLDQNITQAELAERSGVSKRTVERLESGAVGTQLSGFLRVCRALQLLERLDAWIAEPAPSPIAQLKLLGRQRKRASAVREPGVSGRPWVWGDET